MSKDAALQELIFVQYVDHVLFNRASAIAMQPQVREAIGWLIYECDQYITLCWDRDAEPPTLHGGDPKASGLVLLKSDISMLKQLKVEAQISHGIVERVLNSKQPIVKDEYAFRPTERKTHGAKTPKRNTGDTTA
ncbi:MAG: hypothetical protein ACFCUE_04430 [Candidatus Bathyarchaeia archaeon]|jgi:hypothetical protein